MTSTRDRNQGLRSDRRQRRRPGRAVGSRHKAETGPGDASSPTTTGPRRCLEPPYHGTQETPRAPLPRGPGDASSPPTTGPRRRLEPHYHGTQETPRAPPLPRDPGDAIPLPNTQLCAGGITIADPCNVLFKFHIPILCAALVS